MTLLEWSAQITKEALAEGWAVKNYQDFPLVATPAHIADKVRFLQHKFSMPVQRIIYAEGVLLVPVGTPT